MTLLGDMAIESAQYVYAVIFAAGAYITYRWFYQEEEEQKQFNFRPMESAPVQASVFFTILLLLLDSLESRNLLKEIV